MRLSDAIAMGRMLVPEFKQADMDGCALGMACKAVGISTKLHDPEGGYVGLTKKWPWLEKEAHTGFCYRDEIWWKFDQEVMRGLMSLDELIDYVRSVEPAEEEAPAPMTSYEEAQFVSAD